MTRRRDHAGARAARSSRRTRRPAQPAAAIIAARGFRQISDSGALGAAVDAVLAANPAAVADYRAGKAQAIGFLVGQVMKATRGQANAALVQAAVRERLEAEPRGGLNGVGLVEHRAVAGRRRPDRGRATAGPGGPWARYQALKAQDANVARYEAWRGGLRDDGTTGASVAMAVLRRQAQIGGAIAIAGVVLVFRGS